MGDKIYVYPGPSCSVHSKVEAVKFQTSGHKLTYNIQQGVTMLGIKSILKVLLHVSYSRLKL